MAKNLHAPSVFLVRDAGYYKAPSKTLLESFAEDFVEGPVLIVKWSKDEQSVVFLTNACPAEAIKADTLPDSEKWVEMNRQYASVWPNITRKGKVPEDADEWLKIENKFEKFFNPAPGKTQ